MSNYRRGLALLTSDVNRGYWRLKVSEKGVKKSQIEFKMPGICQKIILHPNYDTYEFNFWYV